MEVVGLQQARKTQIVVGMEVGQVDVVHRHQTEGAHQLPLGTFTTIDQDSGASSADQNACGRPPCGRHGTACPHECDGEIHCCAA